MNQMQYCHRYGEGAIAYRSMLVRRITMRMRMVTSRGAMLQLVLATIAAIAIAKSFDYYATAK